MLLDFDQISYLLNDSEVSYAELRRNIIMRSAEYEEQSKIRSRSRRQSSVDFFSEHRL